MTTSESELRELVRRYRVTWEARSEMGPSGRSVAPIGYVVELNAVGDDPQHAKMMTPPETHEVEEALEKIASAVAETEISHVNRGTWQLGTGHGTRPEVTATVTVLHHDGGNDNRPRDAQEHERLEALLGRIRALGAQERHWRDGGGA
jgi:hypothetical protein